VRAQALGHDDRAPPSGFSPGTMAGESRSAGSGAAAGATWGVGSGEEGRLGFLASELWEAQFS
jgi:hypothetical protein